MPDGTQRAHLNPKTLLFGVCALAAVCAVTLYAAVAGGQGFPLDDAWIHQTYARNLAETGQWAFVPFVPSAGSTSPLFTVLLAIGYLPGIPYMLYTHVLGAVALALTAMVGADLARRLFPDVSQVGLWAGLALVSAWHLVWAAASGMETILFGAGTLIVLDLAVREIEAVRDLRGRMAAGAAFGVCGALLIATRPEGAMLVGLAGVWVMLALLGRDQQDRRDWRVLAAWVVGGASGGIIGLAPYLLLNLSLSGSILPNTFGAKQAEYAPLLARSLPQNLADLVPTLLAGPQIGLVPGAIAALVVRRGRATRPGQPRSESPNDLAVISRSGGDKRTRARARPHADQSETGTGATRAALRALPLMWVAALVLLYALRLPVTYHHGRYLIPALPALIVVGTGGTLMMIPALVRWSRRRLLARVLVRTALITCVALFPVFLGMGASIYSTDVWRINSDMVTAARWLDAHIPPDGGGLLAVHDIGAVGFFANSTARPRPILDLAGLVSPEVVPLFGDPWALAALMRDRGVRYLLLLPDQWDSLWLGESETLGRQYCPIYNAGGGMGGMTLYEFSEFRADDCR